MHDKTHSTYDEVPYESHPFPESHPDRLATMALLFGMQPAPVQQCRVLELGCAAGGNLIPIAAQFPKSEFIGIDLAARQIADGKAQIAALGLRNIRLLHQSILDFDVRAGTSSAMASTPGCPTRCRIRSWRSASANSSHRAWPISATTRIPAGISGA